MTLKRISLILCAGAALALLPFFGSALAQVTLTHVHGLSYSADGERLMIPSHHGLAVYENGKWSKAPGPQHDYMGFSATAKNLYSSGHPAPGSGLVNPFGLIRSQDGGRTWDKLGLEGETDFHLLATGWKTNAIYVWNPAPSSRMKRPGLHYTLNEGLVWKAAQARGLQGDPYALAVHPTDKAAVAVATSEGVFRSADAGASFRRVSSHQGTAVLYDLDGKHLWYGSYDGEPRLSRTPLGMGPARQIAIPPLERDAVAYIAQNPAKRDEYAIATFQRSVFLTHDAGGSWTAIAERGQASTHAPAMEEISVAATRRIALEKAGVLPHASHELRLSAYVFRGTRWPHDRIEAAVVQAGKLIGQCGVALAGAQLHVVEAPRRFHFYSTPVSRALLRELAVSKPAVFFVEDTRNEPAYDAEAIGRENASGRPELADTVWVAYGAKDLPQALAHELVHVLSNSGAHSEAPRNLMAAATSPGRTQLSAAQCERMRAAGVANGLIAARAPRRPAPQK
jgi:photosystem II stability/assembly factor-like uncharacterized protein